MSNSSPQDSSSTKSSRKRLWLTLLTRGGLAVGGLLLLGIIGGAWRLQEFVKKELAPLAQKNLTTTLNRPVQLGSVKEFSLTGVKFDASSIPATPTDSDRITIESIEVGFDIWQLVWHRHLQLDVTLVNPDIYIEQDDQGRWISTKIEQGTGAALVKTELDKLRLRNAKAILVPQKREGIDAQGVAFSELNGTAQIVENNSRINFDLAGQTVTQSKVFLQGYIRPGQVLTGDLRVNVQDLPAADVTRLIKLPLTLQTGKVNGDLQVQVNPQNEALITGNASLQGVTIQIPKLPQKFNNTNGNVSFQGLAMRLDNIVTSFGKIPLVANGVIDRKDGFNLKAQVNAISLAKAQETLKVKLPVPASGLFKANLQVLGTISQPILSGSVSAIKPVKVDRVDLLNVSSDFALSTADSTITLKNIQAEPKLGGDLTGEGVIKLGQTPAVNFNITAQSLPGDAIAQLYNANPPIKVGQVAATVQTSGVINNLQTLIRWQAPQATYPATGEAILNPDRSLSFRNVAVNLPGGTVRGFGTYANQRWQAVIQAAGLKLAPFLNPEQLQNVSLEDATFQGRLIVSGSAAPFKLENVRTEGAGIQIAGGSVNLTQVELEDRNFAAELIAKGIRVGRILKQSSPISQGLLDGKFVIAGNLDNLNLKTLRGLGTANLAVAGGNVVASNIKLIDGNYQAQVLARNIAVQELANVPPQLRGRLAGQFIVAGNVESFQPQNIQAIGQGQLQLASGTVVANNIKLANGRYQAQVATNRLLLNRFNQALQGQLNGKLQVAGNITSTKLADIQAAGNLQLSQGVVGLDSPLNATIAWNGEKLTVVRASGQNLNASGYILANATQPGIPTITQLNLNIQAKNFNLQKLPVRLPNFLGIAGKADFSGLVGGSLTKPNVNGLLALRDLKVKDIAFDRLLAGNVSLNQGQNLSVDLAGKNDRLALNLNTNRPNSFLVKWQQALATGQATGDNWAVKVENFPLKVLSLKVPGKTILSNSTIAGLLTGDLQLNQKTFATQGKIAIAKPELGRIKGDSLNTEFIYQNGVATLTNSKFIKSNSIYAFDATVKQTSTIPQVQAKINISNGNIQDVLTAAQLFEIKDIQRGLAVPTYGKAADLVTTPQGLPNQSLFSQIQRLYEIDALLAEQQQQRIETQPIPYLSDLKGIFNGDIAINNKDDLTVQFNLKGNNFVWGREEEPTRFYQADQVIAEGAFEKGVLRLQPLRITSENRLIAFTGYIGGKEQSGQLRVNNFPIELLSNFVQLPVGISGNLNVTAGLSGSLSNPNSRGELELIDGTLNQKKITSANAGFSYADGRLNFGSTIIASGPEPVTIKGSIPYKLPFATVEPDSNQINLDIQVRNEGLALINLLTNQITFESGEGEVDVKVRGTRLQPLVKGIATLNNASFVAQALPGKITNVSGKAEFDFDRILVESLQGKFSQGSIEAAGEIPIFNSAKQLDNPLTVNLDKLAIALKGLYQGGVSGNLKITGSALRPAIGGNLELSNGLVLLAESTTTDGLETKTNTTTIKASKQNKADVGGNITRLNNLEIKLGKNVQIARPPVLNFLASGDLVVSGSLSDPIPEGTIKLISGGVNLFTTQLVLARGHEHTATFRASQPRDPNLNIRLSAKVLDVVQGSDIRQNSGGLAGLESIRVEANIKGLASQLNENLELTSSPSRSQTEIVTLLGGGFVGTQGRGDSTLGLINIAGSAVFNNFQGAFNQIGNAFGLSELRLFPTILSDRPEAGRSSSTLELALEAGVDISNKVSISSIKILTANDPFQWGINYRINNQFRVRASTNLTDDSRAVVEFERRF
jgi:translocation and assembly module TamB